MRGYIQTKHLRERMKEIRLMETYSEVFTAILADLTLIGSLIDEMKLGISVLFSNNDINNVEQHKEILVRQEKALEIMFNVYVGAQNVGGQHFAEVVTTPQQLERMVENYLNSRAGRDERRDK